MGTTGASTSLTKPFYLALEILMGQPEWEYFCSCGAEGDGGVHLTITKVMQMQLCWSARAASNT